MKKLVVYFSVYKSTKAFAEEIAKQTWADIAPIEPVIPYDEDTSHYEELAEYAKKEHDEDMRPEIKNEINIQDYDVIFIWYPMWWYTMPMIMYTFFDKYDFTWKIIVPFNTHEWSWDWGTYKTIRELEPNAEVKNWLPIRWWDVEKWIEEKVRDWLLGLYLD